MSNAPLEFRPSGTIDFEHVEIRTEVATPAAAPVDDKMDTDPLSINFEREKAAKPTAAERMLAGATIDWLIAFPLDSRPKALCDRFPHVANRLAKCWADKAASARSLELLVADKRWGSAGFPAQVLTELQRLAVPLAAAS